MRTPLLPPPSRVDPAVAAMRQVTALAGRLVEALEALDEAGGPGRALQVGGEGLPVRRTANQIREARDGLSATLGRLAGLVRDGAMGTG